MDQEGILHNDFNFDYIKNNDFIRLYLRKKFDIPIELKEFF